MFRHSAARVVMSGLLSVAAVPAFTQAAKPDFSGTWKRDNAQSTPVRPGDAVMTVAQHDAGLRVETTTTQPHQPERHSVQEYTTDGRESTRTAADGDHLVTRVTWQDGGLRFSVDEHQEKKVLHFTETWTLSADGQTLTRVRHGDADDRRPGDQRTVYLRQR